jgi:hypothetical protein
LIVDDHVAVAIDLHISRDELGTHLGNDLLARCNRWPGPW